MKKRDLVFLRDVFWVTILAIGGPHSHIPLFLKKFVNQRKYLNEEEFLELQALCQMVPGPTSTQTLTSIGYKLGGATLAYFTLLIWVFPSFLMMTFFAITINYFNNNDLSLAFTKYIEPMAVAFVSYAAWIISSKTVNSKLGLLLMSIAAITSFFFRSPYMPPLLILIGGLTASLNYKKHPKIEDKPVKIEWKNLILFFSVLIFVAILGSITKSRYILLFENFYRNGSLVFGGGQILIPLLHNEFVDFKHYLTSAEFLTGYALVQALPGPIFVFSSYIGALTMREYGCLAQIGGSIASTAGVFLPGTFLIFFVYNIWFQIKKYRFVRASLEGINAICAGLVISSAIIILNPIQSNYPNLLVVMVTFVILLSEKISSPFIIGFGLLMGFIL